jgi:hypothetical protein
MRERGPLALGGASRLPSVGPEESAKFGKVQVCLTNTGLLMEDAKNPSEAAGFYASSV